MTRSFSPASGLARAFGLAMAVSFIGREERNRPASTFAIANPATPLN